jgi:membrane peptidoglycan carboxypeptidase
MRTAERSEARASATTKRRAWRRPLLAIVGLALAGVVALLAVAWFAVGSAGDVGARVRADLQAHHAAFVPLDAVAPAMRQAVVDTEDERFYRHHGIDLIGLARSAAYDVTHLSLQQGASTITEQLAKDMYLDGDDHSVWRKLKDAALALHIESRLSKEQILGDYLNTVYFGAGSFGIGQASQRYFGTTPAHLSLADASMLAGLIQAPSADDPLTDPGAARSRQADVLTSMIRNHDITLDEGERVMVQPLRLAGGKTIPAVTSVDLAPGPAFSGPEMAAGLAVLIGSIVVLAVLWRRRSRMWRVLPAATAVVGLFLAARALHGA